MIDIALDATIPTLRVVDVSCSLPTYTALGFALTWQHQLTPDAPRLTSMQQGVAQLFLTEHAVAPVGAVVYFNTRGLDALVARAVAAGVLPTFGPENRPWGSREAYFTDPDGNVLRFGERLS